MLTVLGILNFYWYALLARMGYRFIFTDAGAVDTQKNDSKTIEGKHRAE